jgi:REP element-mobilizing transposase RayT
MRIRGCTYGAGYSYFVTTNVSPRYHAFGEVVDKVMYLNEVGYIAYQQLLWLTTQFPYARVDVFSIMPDHVHAIISINEELALPGIKIKPLPELMGAYKTTTSKYAHEIGQEIFKWQKSYHAFIIPDLMTYDNIVRYIRDNPINWGNRRYNKTVPVK